MKTTMMMAIAEEQERVDGFVDDDEEGLTIYQRNNSTNSKGSEHKTIHKNEATSAQTRNSIGCRTLLANATLHYISVSSLEYRHSQCTAVCLGNQYMFKSFGHC